jgi:hypothetical protein
MLLQHLSGLPHERHGAPIAVFAVLEGEHAAFEIDLRPMQAEQCPLAAAGQKTQQNNRVEMSVATRPAGLEQALAFLVA